MLDIFVVQEYLHIGNERYVTVKSFNGQTRVDIRQYDKFGDKIYPTKSGVHLCRSQFVNLLDLEKEIDNDVSEFRNKTVESFKYHLGDEVYVTATVGFPLVHIRLHYKNEDMSVALPTKVGVALRFDEWDALVNILEKVQKLIDKM